MQQKRSQEEVLIESLKFENQLMRAQLRKSYSRYTVQPGEHEDPNLFVVYHCAQM